MSSSSHDLTSGEGDTVSPQDSASQCGSTTSLSLRAQRYKARAGLKSEAKATLADVEMKNKAKQLRRAAEDLEDQARVNKVQALVEKADAEEAAIQLAEAEDAGLALPASPVPVPVSTAAPYVLPPPTLTLPSPPAIADVRPKFTSAATAAISTQNEHSQNNSGLRLVSNSIVERDSMS